MPIKALLVVLLAFPFLSQSAQDEAAKSPLPKHFTQRLGTFSATMTFYQAPGKIAFQASGKQVNKLICGGLWLEGDLLADIGGTKFHGRSVFGQDPKTKSCSGTWVDSMSSHLMVQTGKLDATGKKLVTKAQVEVEGGGTKPGRLETVMINKDQYDFYMYILGGDKDFLSMKIEYRRQ